MTDELDNDRKRNSKKPSQRNLIGSTHINPKKLEVAAFHYLQRFSTSAENLRRVLMRRVLRSAHHYNTDVGEATEWVDEVVVKMQERGFVNDRVFAEGRVHSLLGRGIPLRGIRLQLRKKGVDDDIIDEVLSSAEDDAGDINFVAAIVLAKRRRLGPFSTKPNGLKKREKDIASLARAGFDIDTARRIIDAKTPGDLEVK